MIVGILVSVGSSLGHTEPVSCSIAGGYEGTYESPADHGLIEVVVYRDGTIRGKARSSKNGVELSVGGVVNSKGYFSTPGSVDGGATFTGNFAKTPARGDWELTETVNGVRLVVPGTWQADHRVPADGCQ